MRRKYFERLATPMLFIMLAAPAITGCYKRNSSFDGNLTTSAILSNQTVPYQYSETTEIDLSDNMTEIDLTKRLVEVQRERDREAEQIYREEVIQLLTEIRDLLRESKSSPQIDFPQFER